MTAPLPPLPAIVRKTKRFGWEAIEGYLFISPWLIGLLVFTLGPMLFSLYLSFTTFDPRGAAAPTWVGLDNYRYAFNNTDENFYTALINTGIYAIIAIPLGMIGSLLVAILMNQEVPGIKLFRTLYYLPAVLPTLAVGMVFLWLFNTDFGLVNHLLISAGMPPVDWLGNPKMVLPSYIITSLWGVGGGMMVLIAALKGIPKSLYEAATIDGANWWHQFTAITLPQLSFVLFFNLIMGIIGAFQVFDIAYVMGGQGNSNLFYVLYLYQAAWSRHRMGYASALGWILFFIILLISLLVIKSSPLWVYYEGEKRKS
ncbi:MAG: sugar ABC transporter permease [Candidatus Sericytochromatia bacterium]|nr:sugar ABC transporter permease [Candidatus Sericytochromatia bacterium]